MDVVADASVFLSVALREPAREWVIERTRGRDIVSPDVLYYEIGNALIALKKRGMLDGPKVASAFDEAQKIAVYLVPLGIHDALKIALRYNIYAYDAYYLQCAIERGLPLLTLDGGMRDIAEKLKITLVE
jgi:predicted nucleic acid-binding protein